MDVGDGREGLAEVRRFIGMTSKCRDTGMGGAQKRRAPAEGDGLFKAQGAETSMGIMSLGLGQGPTCPGLRAGFGSGHDMKVSVDRRLWVHLLQILRRVRNVHEEHA